MICPVCKQATEVIDARPSTGNFRRRRRCKSCGYRFTTREHYVDPLPLDTLKVSRKEFNVLMKTILEDVEEIESYQGPACLVKKYKVPEAFIIGDKR